MGLTFTLNIPSKTDNPIHQLSEVMTVGSQVGDLILRDPSVEAKHCTFLVNDDVVSIIDHESSVGTFVHGERIPSSRMIILNNGDRLKIGEVDVELIAQDSGDGTANILLYSLGAVSQNDGKSVEQLIVDQIINEVASIESSAPEPMPTPKSEEIVYSDDDATGDIIIPKTMKKPELSDEDSDDEVTGEIGVAIEEFKEESKKIEVIYRTFSFLIEFLFAYSIYHLILQDYLSPIFNNVISEIFLLVENLPIVYFILEDLRPLIPIWALYGVLRCLSVLFLKVSWSQKILGFKAQSKNALANMSREFLGLILGPFIFFDLVLIKGEDTLKETLTKTTVTLVDKKRAIFYSFILLPVVIVAAFISPLFHNLELPKSIPVSFEKTIKAQDNMTFVSSVYFGFKFPEKLIDSETMLPMLQKQDKKNLFIVIGHDEKSKTLYQIKKMPSHFIRPLIVNLAQRDPLFRFNYPLVHSALFEGVKNEIAIESELKTILQNSLELGFYTSFNHLLNYGPFFNGYLSLKRELSKSVNIYNITQAKFLNIYGQSFLKLLNFNTETKRSEILLIPLSLNPGYYFHLSSENKLNELEKISIKLWNQAKLLPQTNLLDLEVQPKTVFSTIDYLNKTEKQEGELDLTLLEYLSNLKNKVNQKLDEKLNKSFQQSNRSIIKYVEEYLKDKNELPQTKQLLNGLKELE